MRPSRNRRRRGMPAYLSALAPTGQREPCLVLEAGETRMLAACSEFRQGNRCVTQNVTRRPPSGPCADLRAVKRARARDRAPDGPSLDEDPVPLHPPGLAVQRE